jgi:membrane protein YdbS with pleckstrin-like domain
VSDAGPEPAEPDDGTAALVDARRPLDPRVLRLWRIEAAIWWGVALLVGGGIAVLMLVTGTGELVAVLILVALVLLAVLAVVGPSVRYRAWRYEVGDEGLLLEHGVVTRTTSLTPFRRIQHVDVASGPIERSLGLGHLVLHTASATTDASIPGIPLDEADHLRSVILERAGAGDAV